MQKRQSKQFILTLFLIFILVSSTTLSSAAWYDPSTWGKSSQTQEIKQLSPEQLTAAKEKALDIVQKPKRDSFLTSLINLPGDIATLPALAASIPYLTLKSLGIDIFPQPAEIAKLIPVPPPNPEKEVIEIALPQDSDNSQFLPIPSSSPEIAQAAKTAEDARLALNKKITDQMNKIDKEIASKSINALPKNNNPKIEQKIAINPPAQEENKQLTSPPTEENGMPIQDAFGYLKDFIQSTGIQFKKETQSLPNEESGGTPKGTVKGTGKAIYGYGR